MNDQSHKPDIEFELEARIAALVLGEASDLERDQLQRLIEERPELAALKAQFEAVNGLMHDVVTGEDVAANDDWQLPTERRNALLSVIDGESKMHLERSNVPSHSASHLSVKQRSWWKYSKVAAVLCAAGCLGMLALSGSFFLYSSTSRTASVALARRDIDATEELASRGYVGPQLRGGTDTVFDMSTAALLDNSDSMDTQSSTSSLLAIRESLTSGQTLPSPYYLNDDVQYFPANGRNAEMLRENSNKAKEAQASGPVAEPASGSAATLESAGRELDKQLADLQDAEFSKSNDAQQNQWSAQASQPSSEGTNYRYLADPNDALAAGSDGGMAGASRGVIGGGGYGGGGYGGEAKSQDYGRGLGRSAGQRLSEVDEQKPGAVHDLRVPSESMSRSPSPSHEPFSSLEDFKKLGDLADTTSESEALFGDVSIDFVEDVDLAIVRSRGGQVTGAPKEEALGEFDQEERLKTDEQITSLVEAYNDLMDKGSFSEAEVVAEQVGALDRNSTIAGLLGSNAKNARRIGEYEAINAVKENSLVDAMLEVDEAAIPFDDRQPLLFPNAKGWEDLTKSRASQRLLPGQDGQADGSEFERTAKNQAGKPFAADNDSKDGLTSSDDSIDSYGFGLQLQSTPNAGQGEQAQSQTERLPFSGTRPIEAIRQVPEHQGKSSSGIVARPTLAPQSLNETNATDESFSTFSLHVSDVSFKLAQAALAAGNWPEAAKVRIEEFVNAFDYGDPLPSPNEKVSCRVEQSIHPSLQQRNVLRVSLRTAATGRASTTPLRLTLLLDNSGSMERSDRQQTVRRCFSLLAQQLTARDQVTLISFARQPRLLADKVSGDQSQQLVGLIEDLPSEGGTNIEAALQLAFEKAREQQADGAQSRIILLTDGAVNLGDANPESLSHMVTTIRDAGIAFDAAGISADGLNDEVLEALTRQGDGRYYLLDSNEAADDGFARQIAGALRPSAKNVKVQIEFNPKRVGRYKLLGFEKHRLKQEDFRNDQVDAAEMAAAEAGVAVYQFEAKPDGEGDVGSVSVRFRDLTSGQMVENRWPIPYAADAPRLDQASPSLRLATSAALLAAKLRGEPLGETIELQTLSDLITGLPDRVRRTIRVEQLQQMIQQARQVSGN